MPLIGRKWLAWFLWLIAASAAAVPAARLRIANSLDDWIPELRAVGEFESYVVVGWPAGSVDAAAGARLRALPSVAQCLDAPLVRLTGPVLGVTAENFVVGPDGRCLGAFCFRRKGVDDAAFVAEVRNELERIFAPAGFHLAGPAVYHVTLDQLSQRHLPAILVSIAVIGTLVLRSVTGSWRIALTAIAAIGLSQLILMGIVGMIGYSIDMSMLMVPLLMMSLGLSYAAHWALRRTPGVGVLVLCAATTALGIGSFITTPMASIRHFAVAGVLGIALVWLAVVMLVPSLSRPARRQAPSSRFLRPLLHAVLGLAARRRRWVVASAIALTAVAAAALPLLRLQTDPLELFPPDHPAVRDFRILDQRLTGLLPFQVTLDQPLDAVPLLAATPGIRKVIDITRMVPGHARTYWCLADNSAQQKLIDAQPRWQRWAKEHGAKLEWRGVAAQLARANQAVFQTAAVSLPSMALIAALAAACTTRSLRLALAAAWITLLPVAMLWTLIALIGWPLGLPAMMIGAITIGVAVDDTLHITASTRRRGSPRRAVLRCWRPCIGSSLAGSTCLACFALSPFLPTFQFGILMSAAILLAAAANHVVLASLLNKPRRAAITLMRDSGDDVRCVTTAL